MTAEEFNLALVGIILGGGVGTVIGLGILVAKYKWDDRKQEKAAERRIKREAERKAIVYEPVPMAFSFLPPPDL
jgi:hypothetical protein